MTTIAYRDGVLASDSRLTFSDHICTDKCKKIWTLPDGTLFGVSGDNEPALLILASLMEDEELPAFDTAHNVIAMHVLPKGQIYISEGRLWERWPEPYTAIGSGGKYALAAMRAGASAVDAVKVGISLDVYSGGRVQRLSMKRKRK